MIIRMNARVSGEDRKRKEEEQVEWKERKEKVDSILRCNSLNKKVTRLVSIE